MSLLLWIRLKSFTTLKSYPTLTGRWSLVRWLWPFGDAEHLLRWTRVLSLFAGTQVAVQFMGFVGGLIVVRSLTKEEYAIYTIAGSALGLLTVLSDLGVSNALLTLGGRVWQDDDRLAQLVRSGLKLQWLFFAVAASIASLFLFTLGLKAGRFRTFR